MLDKAMPRGINNVWSIFYIIIRETERTVSPSIPIFLFSIAFRPRTLASVVPVPVPAAKNQKQFFTVRDNDLQNWRDIEEEKRKTKKIIKPQRADERERAQIGRRQSREEAKVFSFSFPSY